jgi:membrane-associated protease RseP (regulator of RpoE activity)
MRFPVFLFVFALLIGSSAQPAAAQPLGWDVLSLIHDTQSPSSTAVSDKPDDDTEKVVIIEGDAGVSIRGTTVEPLLNGGAAPSDRVVYQGDDFRITDADGQTIAEVCIRNEEHGPELAWIWGPRPYLRATVEPLALTVRGLSITETNLLDRPRADAVVIDDVAPGSAADAAGLRRGDVLVGVDGEPRATPLRLLTAARNGTDRVDIRLLRNGQAVSRTIPLTRPAGREK